MLIANRYELIEQLGSGGMGEVYRAHDRLTNTIVALKRVLAAPESLNFNSRSTDNNLVLSLAREFTVLASLRHPYIISVLDYGFDAGRIPFFTMDYLPKTENILQAGKTLDTSQKLKFIIQLLQGLGYLHRRGLLHRDLKPGNVMVHNHKVKIIDFGLAIEIEQVQDVSGTITYIAPEVLAGSPASIASDLYAVGLIMYELFLDRHPFPIKDNIIQFISDLMNEVPDYSPLPPELQPVTACLLAKNPKERYTNAFTTLQALSNAIGMDVQVETIDIRESFLQASIFVGRKAELQRLEKALDDAMAGDSSGWLIGGESGIGKSRLVDELRIRALVRGFTVLKGYGVEGGGLPWQLWPESIRRLVLTVPIDEIHASILKEIVPDISTLLGYEVPDAPPMTGVSYGERLNFAIIELFRKFKQPLLLILEDLQWTQESLVVIQQMFKIWNYFSNLMIVGTYRNDERPDIPDKFPNMTVIGLSRFSKAEINQLGQSILGESIAHTDVIQLLEKETEGNTFFMLEVIRTLAEQAGSLAAIGTITLPAGVFTGQMQDILERRLDKLSAEDRALLELAAVAGRQLDMEVLRLTDPSVKWQRWLYRCDEATVLNVNEDTWQFAHDKIRQTVLDGIAPHRLPALYQQIAESTEQLYGHLPTYAYTLTELWHRAGNVVKEVEFSLVSIEQMQIRGALEASCQLALRILANAEPLDSITVARLHNFAGTAYERLSNYEQAIEHHEIALRLGQGLGNRQHEVYALLMLSWIYLRQGNEAKAEQLALQAGELAQIVDDLGGYAGSLNNLGVLARRRSQFELAENYYLQSMAIREQLGDKQRVGWTLHNIGVLAIAQGDYPKAQKLLEQSLVISRELGNPRGVYMDLLDLGELALNQENYPTSYKYYSQALAGADNLGDVYHITLAVAGLLETSLNLSMLKEAHKHLQRLTHLLDKITSQHLQMVILLSAAIFAKEGGHREQAYRWVYFIVETPGVAQDIHQKASQIKEGLLAKASPSQIEQWQKAVETNDMEAVLQQVRDYVETNVTPLT